MRPPGISLLVDDPAIRLKRNLLEVGHQTLAAWMHQQPHFLTRRIELRVHQRYTLPDARVTRGHSEFEAAIGRTPEVLLHDLVVRRTRGLQALSGRIPINHDSGLMIRISRVKFFARLHRARTP